MKNSGIGGQAVIEGVMMRNKETYAVSVRLDNGEIVTKKDKYFGIIKNKFLTETPLVRGFFKFLDSLVLGTKTLTWAADQFVQETEEDNTKSIENKNQHNLEENSQEEQENKKDKINSQTDSEEEGIPTSLLITTIAFSLIFSIALFVLLPFVASNLMRKAVNSSLLIAFIEGVIRLGIFVLYIAIISRMKDIKRVYMYHGAEHKCINCIENGYELTVENARKASKEHKRCGTSFMIFVILFSVIIGMFIRVKTLWLKVIIRILIIPLIAGISYEFIRFAGKSNSKVMGVLSKPGLWMQGLTVKEPDDSMIEVAIKSVEAVFDTKDFLAHYNDKE